jgi:hypothetical protein
MMNPIGQVITRKAIPRQNHRSYTTAPTNLAR